MLNLLNPGTWLVAILALAVSFGAGWMEKGKRVEAEKAVAASIAKDEALSKERQARDAVQATAAGYQLKLAENQKRSDDEMSKLRKKLAAMPVCAVSGDTVGMLYPMGAVSLPGSTPAGLRTSSFPAYADSTCAAQLELAARNYREVCIPNAEQLIGVQKAYSDVQQLFKTKK